MAVSGLHRGRLDGGPRDAGRGRPGPGVGISENCHRALYTLSNDGVIYVEWDEGFDFQIGQFLWIWEFPHLDMDESQSKIFVNGEESPFYISSKIEDGFHYRAEFISKEYDISKERDFLPPNP